ncbi:MAG: cobalt-precorrin hydrolase [Thermoanaerobacter sp.]|nr:cobalt-precorrin hydrolase [Thermoanaerobacter sp.]
MKIAVVAVTRRGAAMAARASAALAGLPGAEVEMILPSKFASGYPGTRPYSGPLADLCGELFMKYRGLVMVMALGIVFRILAPYVQDKRKDPAVVVMDERGQFAVSALSGHLGGANDLARYLQRKLGCRAVITTATDVHGLPAVDLLARDYDLVMEPFEMVKAVNAAIVNGETVCFYSETDLNRVLPLEFTIQPLECYDRNRQVEGLHVFITNKVIAGPPPGALFLRPRNLVVGLGCRKGIGAAAVKEAVEEALRCAGRSLSSVRLLATVDIRAGEEGLVQAAKEMEFPLVSFTRDEIAGIFRVRGEELSFSQYVFDKIGVGGVCEPAALLAAPAAKLILKKKALNGVTVAVAEEAWP